MIYKRKFYILWKKDFYIERCNKKLDFIITKKINKYFIDFNNKLNIDFDRACNKEEENKYIFKDRVYDLPSFYF